jgi:biopolymer transport protein ExbB
MENIFEFVAGNFLHVAPILIAGVIASAIVLERFRALVLKYPLRNIDGFFDHLRDLLMADRLAEAIAFCDKQGDKPVAHVARVALLRAHQPETLIIDGLEIAIGKAIQKIQKRTAFLSAIANVSTLLGLFGTIVGLIQSFQAVGTATAQARSALLASGISTAMNATMLGLAVAIPSMIAFSYLMNRSNRLVSEVENSGVQILDLIKQRYYSAEMEDSSQLRKAG